MKRKDSVKICNAFLILAFLAIISGNALNSAAANEEWHFFQKDISRSGESGAIFASADFKLLWEFSPTSRVWDYRRGYNVWSDSVSIADVAGRGLVFAGFYNNNLYALDIFNGSLVWRFIAGGGFSHAPVFSFVNGRPLVFAACRDRSIYALDARSGERVWSYETQPWSYSVSEAIISSPLVINAGKRKLLAACVWNSSLDPLKGFQKGELFLFDAATGRKIYSRYLSETPLNSPVFGRIKGRPVFFISSQNGKVVAVNALNGSLLWEMTACAEVRSSPALRVYNGRTYLLFGTRFGNVYCLDAQSGKIAWRKKTGHGVDATPAFAVLGDTTAVLFGSYDRNVYAFNLADGGLLWKFRTGNYVVSSCVTAGLGEGKAVFLNSLDNRFYCLSAVDGRCLWSYTGGGLIWKYYTRGDSLWSSPAVYSNGSRSVVLFPCYDGKLYAFSS